MKRKALGLIGLFIFITSTLISQTLHINLRNIKDNGKGVIRVALFQNEAAYLTEKDCITYVYEKTSAKEGSLTIQIPVKPGVYGITALDDTDNSGIMEYNRLGIPKKGFGFSDYSPRIMRKPKFSSFCFNISENEVKEIEVKMCYLPF